MNKNSNMFESPEMIHDSQEVFRGALACLLRYICCCRRRQNQQRSPRVSVLPTISEEDQLSEGLRISEGDQLNNGLHISVNSNLSHPSDTSAKECRQGKAPPTWEIAIAAQVDRVASQDTGSSSSHHRSH